MSGAAIPAAGLFALLVVEAAPAQPPLPFATADRNPVVALHGLPDSASLFPVGDSRFRVSVEFDAANTLHDETFGGERLFFDGESRRTTLRAGYRFADDWMLEVSVPYIEHSGGSLDAFIDDFHAVFGFPGGGRGEQPRDQLRFEYLRDGESVLSVTGARSGLGDISAAVGHSLAARAHEGASLWAQLKTTTGSPGRLTGSGAVDFSAWLAGWRRFAAAWAGYAAGGGLLMGPGDVLAAQQRDWAWFARAGGEFQPLPWLALQVELSVHGPLYESETRLLGESAQITMGGWLRAFGESRLHIAVSEDVRVGSAPDVVFHLAWRSVY